MRQGGEEQLRQAVRLAPSCSAQAALAAAFAFHESPAPEAFEAVEKTLSLEPNHGEVYATLGFIRMVHHWDWKGAEQAFRKALQLAPQYPPRTTGMGCT
jgi:cytochrome c-type biogenesis protein CcmH/NrfG